MVGNHFYTSDLGALAKLKIYPDVNSDGVVDVIDLLLVAVEIGSTANAPMLLNDQIRLYNLSSDNVSQWIKNAKQRDFKETQFLNGIVILEQILAILTSEEKLPKITALRANYPNPFNPETWIPYQLAASSKVQITIYNSAGNTVRTLILGHQSKGFYTTRNRAAYWDGRNAIGEPVSSGVYFYTLITDRMSATRKMLILK